MDSAHRYLEIDRRDDLCCVRLRIRRLDEEQLTAMTDELFALIKEEGCRKLALCLGPEPPQFLYSVFLARLVAVQRVLREHDGSLVLCELRPEVFRIFEACRLDTQFQFAPNLEEGCAVLRGITAKPGA